MAEWRKWFSAGSKAKKFASESSVLKLTLRGCPKACQFLQDRLLREPLTWNSRNMCFLLLTWTLSLHLNVSHFWWLHFACWEDSTFQRAQTEVSAFWLISNHRLPRRFLCSWAVGDKSWGNSLILYKPYCKFLSPALCFLTSSGEYHMNLKACSFLAAECRLYWAQPARTEEKVWHLRSKQGTR